MYSNTIKDYFQETLEVSLVNFQIREGKQYQLRLFISWSQEMIRYHHNHHHVTTILCHHVTHFFTMEKLHPSPLHGSPPSSYHPSSLNFISLPPLYIYYQQSSIEITYQGAQIGSKYVRDQRLAIASDLWEIRSNKWKIILWHSVHMTWISTDLCIKFSI